MLQLLELRNKKYVTISAVLFWHPLFETVSFEKRVLSTRQCLFSLSQGEQRGTWISWSSGRERWRGMKIYSCCNKNSFLISVTLVILLVFILGIQAFDLTSLAAVTATSISPLTIALESKTFLTERKHFSTIHSSQREIYFMLPLPPTRQQPQKNNFPYPHYRTQKVSSA